MGIANEKAKTAPEPKPASIPPQHTYDDRGNILPHVGAKWGVTPKQPTAPAEEDEQRRRAIDEFYTEDEKAKMRAKGINPLLKAEIEMNKTKHGGFFGKLVGTALGGGIVK